MYVLPSCQDRKTNSSIYFLGEVTARQFCFKIYRPLDSTKCPIGGCGIAREKNCVYNSNFIVVFYGVMDDNFFIHFFSDG